MLRHALMAALLVLAGQALAQNGASADDPVVARVGEHEERLSTFDERFEIAVRALVASMGLPMSDALRPQLDSLKPEYLDQRVNDLVLLQEAGNRGITVDDEEIDAIVAASTGGLEGEVLESALMQAGFRDIAHFRELVAETEVIQRVVDDIFEEMTFSEDEVEAWWAANSHQFGVGEQVCAAHILVPEGEHADQLLAELEEGADFGDLAALHSIDPGSGSRGGDLGCFGRGMMVAPFEEAAFGAEIGEVAGPVESQFGFHLILVNERIGAEEITADAFRPQIENALGGERIMDVIGALVATSDVETFPEVLITAVDAVDEAGDDAAGDDGEDAGSEEESDDAGNDADAGEDESAEDEDADEAE